MFGRNIRIGRIAGIPVGVNPGWLLFVALFTWVLGATYYPSEVHGIRPAAAYGLGLLSILLLYASVLAHEFGHALVARRRGIEVQEIDLWLLGGVSRFRGRPKTPGDELRYAAAGPAVTAVIAVLFGLIAWALPATSPAWLRALIDYQLYVNAVLLFFNLLPAIPLDGGRIVRAILWRRRGDIASATNAAATLGRVLGWLMVVLGVFEFLSGGVGGVVLALIGGFVVMAARAEQSQEQMLSALAGITVGELMSAPPVTIATDKTLSEAQREFEHYRYTSFPVVDRDGRAVGLLSIEQLEHVAHTHGYARLVGELADRDPDLLVDVHEDVARLFDRPGFIRVGRAVAVDDAGRAVGIVSLTDVKRAIRVGQLPHDSRPQRELVGQR